MRLFLRTLLLVTVVVAGCRSEGSQVKWAKEVAGHFLDAFAAGNIESVKTVSTKAYQNDIKTINIEGGPLHWSISTHEISPQETQIIFKGILEFKGSGGKRSFTMLTEKENDRWLVSSFTQGPVLVPPIEWKDKKGDKQP